MMDNDLRIRRLLQEAEDPEVAVILLDVVLGFGAHADPARELAPAIQQAFKIAKKTSNALLKGDIVKELDSGKDFPIATKADLSLLIGEVKALKETHALIERVGKELETDFCNLLKSKSFDDFIDNFKDLVKIDELKKIKYVVYEKYQ